MKTLKESYTFTSENGDKSFDELYKDSRLFEDADDLIDPRFKKLFESVYGSGSGTRTKLKETWDFNFSGDEGAPSGDGVPAAHNKAGMGGTDTATNQSYSGGCPATNAKLFNESKLFASIYGGKKLNETLFDGEDGDLGDDLDDDLDDDDDLDFETETDSFGVESYTDEGPDEDYEDDEMSESFPDGLDDYDEDDIDDDDMLAHTESLDDLDEGDWDDDDDFYDDDLDDDIDEDFDLGSLAEGDDDGDYEYNPDDDDF